MLPSYNTLPFLSSCSRRSSVPITLSSSHPLSSSSYSAKMDVEDKNGKVPESLPQTSKPTAAPAVVQPKVVKGNISYPLVFSCCNYVLYSTVCCTVPWLVVRRCTALRCVVFFFHLKTSLFRLCAWHFLLSHSLSLSLSLSLFLSLPQPL